jgi:hypothetical protein
MEPSWSPVVATGGNWSQMERAQKPPNQAKTLAVGCDQLRLPAHGKGRVDVTSLFAKEGVTFLAPQKEIEPANPQRPQDSSTKLTDRERARRGRRE